MAHITRKTVEIQLSAEVYKAAKLKAAQAEQSMQDWLTALIQTAIAEDIPPDLSALDWGRIDSRIDQRTATLEQQVDFLGKQVQRLLRTQVCHCALTDRPVLTTAIAPRA